MNNKRSIYRFPKKHWLYILFFILNYMNRQYEWTNTAKQYVSRKTSDSGRKGNTFPIMININRIVQNFKCYCHFSSSGVTLINTKTKSCQSYACRVFLYCQRFCTCFITTHTIVSDPNLLPAHLVWPTANAEAALGLCVTRANSKIQQNFFVYKSVHFGI